MKRIIYILIFCFCATLAKAQPVQNIGNNTNIVNAKGSLKADSGLINPSIVDTFAAKLGTLRSQDGTQFYNSTNGFLYYKRFGYWVAITATNNLFVDSITVNGTTICQWKNGTPTCYAINTNNNGTFDGVDSVTATTTSICQWKNGVPTCYAVVGNGVDSVTIRNNLFCQWANGDSVCYDITGNTLGTGLDSVTVAGNLICQWKGGLSTCFLINNGGQYVDSIGINSDSTLYLLFNNGIQIGSFPTLIKGIVAGNSGISISDTTIDGVPKVAIYNTGSSGGNFINNERFTTQSNANYNISGAGLADSLLSNQLNVNERTIIGDSLGTINNPSFIFYGNSVTAGALVEQWEAWAYITSSAYHATYLNRAISGTRMTAASPTDSSMINRLYTVQNYATGQYIFLMYGINDNAAGVDSTTYKTTAARVIDTLLIARGYPASHIILCTPPYNTSGGTGLNNIRLATINLANEKGVVGLDVYGYMTGSGYTNGQMILSDGIHPTVLGQRLISERVINTLSSSLGMAGVLNVYGGGYIKNDLAVGQNARIDGGLTVHGDSTIDNYKLTMYKKNSGSNTTYSGIGIESDTALSIFSPRSSVMGFGYRTYNAGNTFTPVLRVYNALGRVSINTTDLGFALSVGGNMKNTGYINTDGYLIVGGSGGTSTIANGLNVTSGAVNISAGGLTVFGDANASDLRWKHYKNGNSVNGIGTLSNGNFNLGYGAGNLVFNAVSTSDGTTLTEQMRLVKSTGNLLLNTSIDSVSSILTAASTTKGILIPRMNTTQISAISSPAIGLLVCNLDSAARLAQWNGTTWVYYNTGTSSSGITALTGDVTASGSGSVTATLATVNSNVGTFGSATQVPVFTVNGKGLITGVTNTTITPSATKQDTGTVWLKAGNDAITASSFIGTINNASLRFRVNNTQRMILDSANGSLAISTTAPDTSAKLDVVSTTRGFLKPRLTTAQMNAISSPADGLEIYNTDEKLAFVYNSDWGWESYAPKYYTKFGTEYFNDFLSPLSGSTDFNLAATASGGVVSATTPTESNRQGIINLSTSTSSTGRAYLSGTSGTTVQTLLLGGGKIRYDIAVRIPTLSTAGERFQTLFGFSTINNSVNITNGVMFLYDEGGVTTGSAASANWQVLTASASSRTFTTTSAAVTANQWYKLSIIVNAAASSVDFLIDDVVVKTETATIPTAAIGFVNQIYKSAGTTARTADIDYVRFKQRYTTPK